MLAAAGHTNRYCGGRGVPAVTHRQLFVTRFAVALIPYSHATLLPRFFELSSTGLAGFGPAIMGVLSAVGPSSTILISMLVPPRLCPCTMGTSHRHWRGPTA